MRLVEWFTGLFLCSGIEENAGVNQANLFLKFNSPAVHKKRKSFEEDDYEETPQEKKLRLAKLYLEQLREDGRSRPCYSHKLLGTLCCFCHQPSSFWPNFSDWYTFFTHRSVDCLKWWCWKIAQNWAFHLYFVLWMPFGQLGSSIITYSCINIYMMSAGKS